MEKITYSRHATVRMQQRGISRGTVALVMEFGQHRPVGGGDRMVWLTRKKRELLVHKRKITASQSERLEGVKIVLSDTRHVITVMHITSRLRN